ncbi:catecholate siderophore receptor Fiu [Acinetobacter chinensis]|uniref:Catecholate siderophore receptor Fiu n=1 Tax=Acinetobacter chinensis TaxID=2004650 RepID=A0ABU3WGR0_9GAMM|nr:catecholate siderophore receptor Fiu [Acinetobacter chinensis]MDV2469507.1 catecholate siderophore receptor Fiu [Acinetobacter chinensis]
MSFIKTRKKIVSTAIASSLSVMATAAIAQDGVTQAQQLETIHTKATAEHSLKVEKASSDKFTQSQLNTTQTMAIIPEKVLKEQNATTLTEALRNVPGVGTFSLGENGRMNTGDAVTMRGFDTANSIFIDGIRDLGNVTRDMFNYEQIEVFKGPAGTDNGRTAASGSINMSTKKAQLEDSNSASLGFGSDEYYRATADINKVINDTTAIRFNAMGESSDGIGRDGVENEKWAAALSAGFGLGTDLRLFLDFLHTEQDNVLDGGIPTVGLPGFDANKSTNASIKSLASYLNSHKVDTSNYYGASEDFDDVTADMVTARIEYDLNDKTKIKNTSRWGKTEHQYLTTFSGNAFTTTNSADPEDASSMRVSGSTNNSDTENQIITNQTSLVTSFNTGKLKHDLSTGVEFTREEMKTRGWTATVTGTNSLYNPQGTVSTALVRNTNGNGDSEGQMDTYSIFAFDTIEISPQFSVNGGVRLDHYKLDSDSFINTAVSGQPANYQAINLKDDGNLFNWKVGALYKPTPNGSLYANYAVQQQAPGTITGGDGIGNANAFAPSTGASSNNNLELDPQEIETIEIGAKWEFFDNRLLLTGALFQTELTNELEKDGDLYYQTGEKSVKGVELGAIGNINDNWQVVAGYTHQKSDIKNVTQAASSQQVSADGSNNMPFTPSDAFTLWTTYTMDKWSIGSGARYNGEMTKNKDGNQVGPAVIPDYWVFDSMVSYQATPNIGIQFNINNLFDEDYINGINRGGLRYITGAERNYRMTLNFKF